MKSRELRDRQDKVRQFSPEWFQLGREIEDALAEEASARRCAERLPAVSDGQVALSDYVLSDEYDD